MEEVITEEEEDILVDECKQYLKRRKLEENHWDQVIVDFKEMERSKWSKESSEIFDKIRSTPILPTNLQYFPAVHVIELAETGYIKPHIDSIKFSGRLVAGLSLLSPSIMRFEQEDVASNFIDALLPRRSFYVMTGRIRYNYTHQILPESEMQPPLTSSHGFSSSQQERLVTATKAAKDAIIQLLTGSLKEEVPFEKWEELVRSTREHPEYEKLYSFPSDQLGWKRTRSKKKSTTLKIAAIDCEMCVVGHDEDSSDINRKALVRVSVVNGEDLIRHIAADLIVHQPEPGYHVIDYKTFIHGLSPDQIHNSKISVAKAQKEVMKYISSDTILVGQSLDGDLKTLRITHDRCIDTALIYQRMTEDTNVQKPGLQDLAQHLLKFEMPQGHDSVLDAQITMLAAIHGAKYGYGKVVPFNSDIGKRFDAALARTCRLRVHRIPKGVNVADIEKFFTEEAKIVPSSVESIMWSDAKGKTVYGSCHVTFLSKEHADLAFKTIPSVGKKKSVTKKRKEGELSNNTSATTTPSYLINYDILGRAQKRIKLNGKVFIQGKAKRQVFWNIQVGVV
ncbi:unnamed protein product [Albugo candida]|uniref:Exonuclease domain-containing protein n=1 Tax=Albugo candida TaxID=65357 RepID=A0A024G2C3_9STRA|nr:unnamed protein product [Albugo candida]|eukprot:CCI40717.1 unnamed protein product [Albugo candida]